MVNDKVRGEIKEYIKKYPSKESAIMPSLMIVQKENNNILSKDDIKTVSKIIGVSQSKAFGVSTFYTMYNVKDNIGKYHIQVDTNIPAILAGAEEIFKYLEKKLSIKDGETTKDNLFTLSSVECLASCGTTPVIQVNDKYYENMTVEKVDKLIDFLKIGKMPDFETEYFYGTECNVLLKNRGIENSTSIEVYKKNGGYKALKKARVKKSVEIIEEVKNSNIKGRGGAGFPTGVKWGFLPKDNSKPVYLICNADEGEPGTFKDRQIMQYDPHLLIEGMAISAYAIGSKLGFIYIRGEFSWIADILEKAIEEARDDLKDFNIIVHKGAGAYICGEETALIESIEGNRGQPRIKPPFPALEGLYGCPTIVNNVETLASIPFIIEKGADKFIEFGTDKNNAGFKLFGISGNVNKPGVYEYPLGTSFNKLIKAAGGVKGTLKAAIVGGLSVAILKADELKDLKMDFDSCSEHNTALGSGGIMVINEDFSIPEIALRTIKFYSHESCGKCTPCRRGSDTIKKILQKIIDGNGVKGDIEKILYLVNNIKGLTLCPVGEAFSIPIKAMIEKFRDEFEQLIK